MMKSVKFLLAVALIGVLLTYSSCSKPSTPAPSATDAQLIKLSKVWKCTSAMLGSPPSAQANYTNFVLTITSSPGNTTFGFSCAGRPTGVKSSPWPASGTFAFGTDVATQLVRDDQLPITYSVSDLQLQMTFNYTGAGFDGRTDVVTGNWVYTFAPQ